MNTVVYDHAIDMSESSVFQSGFADFEASTLYLVFNNGTTISREVPHLSIYSLGGVTSWGKEWNFYLHSLPGERLEGPVEFVARSLVDQAGDEQPEALDAQGNEDDYDVDHVITLSFFNAPDEDRSTIVTLLSAVNDFIKQETGRLGFLSQTGDW